MLWVAAALVLLIHAASQGVAPEFALPLYPVFIVTALGALAGERLQAQATGVGLDRAAASIDAGESGPEHAREERAAPDVADDATAVEPLSRAATSTQSSDPCHGHPAGDRAGPRLDVAELWHYRELLWTLVWRDVVVRYKQTFLGIAWAILVPVFTALVYVVIFGKFADFPAGDTPYPSLVIAGVLPDAVLRLGAHPVEHEPAARTSSS